MVVHIKFLLVLIGYIKHIIEKYHPSTAAVFCILSVNDEKMLPFISI